jgi:Uma2 family endonuclease
MLQAKGFEAQTGTTSLARPSVTAPSQFPYGWRYVIKRSPTGDETYDQIPLTAADLLNPQLGDQVPQRHEHFQVIVDLVAILKAHYANVPTMGVFGDLIMDWGIPGLSGPAPDIAIIPNVKQKDAVGGIFRVTEQGTRPCLVIEVLSPGYPGDDTDKVKIYERAGIPEYFLIRPRLEHGEPHYELSGYQLSDGVYCPLLPTPWGSMLTSQTLQLRFEVADQGRQLRVTDLQTGQRLLTLTETEAARRQEQAARLAATVALQQEQATRLVAEARAEAEAKARGELETRLRELETLLKSRT